MKLVSYLAPFKEYFFLFFIFEVRLFPDAFLGSPLYAVVNRNGKALLLRSKVICILNLRNGFVTAKFKNQLPSML